MKNNLFRKSLSVFLAMLMVLSCWVFVPEVHDHSVAEAVASNVRGVPAIRGSHYAGTTAAYGTPVFDGNLDRWFKFHNKGSDYVQIYYPSNIYLDKSETLQSAGYFFNVNWAFGNSSDYRILIGAPALGDNSAYSGYPEKYYTMTNCFTGYGFDSSVPSGGAKKVYNTSTGGTDYDLRIVGYGHSTQGSDGFNYDGTRHDKYVLYRSYSGNPNTATIYLLGTPNGEYDKKEYNTTGASLGSYGFQQNYKSGWKENNNSMFKQKSYDQANDGCSSYYEGQYAEMQWFVTVYDKSALNAVITNADSLLTQKGKYTTESLNNLQNVLNANRGVLTTRATNQNSINVAKDNIQAAIDNLVEFGVAFDNLFNFNEFVIAGDLTVNERTDKGFTVTSTAADGNTGFSKAIPVVPGKTYVLSADVGITAVSGGYDMYIHTLDANQAGETTAVPDTSNGAHREGDVYISLTGQTSNSTPYIRFTAGSNTKFVRIRFDANTPGNKLTVNNIRLLNETDYEGVSYVPTKMFKNNASLGTSFTVPTRTGYTFKRWYADNDVDGMYDSGEEVTDANGNIVSALSTYKIAQNWILHSDWTEHQYNITFNANGGSGSTAGISNVLYSADTKLTANAFSRTGYTFTGWNTKADGTGTAYADGVTVSKLTATNGATVTLYAQWSINKHTVAFEKIDGTTTSAQYNYGTVASAITKPANTATKDNGDNHTVYSWPEINDVTGNITYKEIGTTSEHNYGDWVITVHPNCETEGSKYRLCQTCGHREDAAVEKAAHTLVHVDAVPSTCTADGNIEYWYCDDCGKMFSDANGTTEITTVVDTAKGHTEEILPAVESSCTATGLTEGKKCSVCGIILVAQQTTNKKAHSMGEWSQTTAPTCTDDGQNTRKCANCDYTETEAVEATGHSYTSTVTAPTCTEKGYTTHTCSKCGDTYTDTETAATGHSYSSWAIYDVTTHRRTCNNCTTYESGTHAFTKDVQPKSGEFHDYACEVCKTRGAKFNGVDTMGAGEACTFEKTTDYKAPTCLEDGYQVYKCSACTNTKTEKLTATDHKWAAATYTWSQTDGVWSCTATRVCENDDTHVQTAYSVEVTFEEAQAATCTEMGKTTYTATFESGVNWVTTQTQTLQDIPALGHSYTAKVTTRPELVDGVWTDGVYTYTCSGCGDSYTQTAVRADYSEFDKAVDELNGLLGNSKLTADARHEIDEALKLAEDLAKNLVSSEQITVNECTDLLKKSISNVNALLDSLGEPQPIVNANSGLKVQFLEQTGAGVVESIQLKAGGGFDPIRLKLTNNNATLPITVTSVAADKANIGSVGTDGTVIAVNGSTDLNITAPAGFNETGIITYTITYKVGSDATGYLMDENGEAVVFTTNAYIYVKGEAYTPYHFMDERAAWPLTATSKWQHYFEAVNYGDFGLISYNSASKFSDNLQVGTSNFGFRHDAYDYTEDGCQAGCENGSYTTGDAHAATYRYYVDTSLAPTWEAAGFRVRITESAESVYQNAPLKYVRLAVDQSYLNGIKGSDKTFTTTFIPSASSNVPNKTWVVTSTGTLDVAVYENPDRSEYLFGEHKNTNSFDETSAYVNFSGAIPVGVTEAKMMFSPRIEFNGKTSSESVTMTSHIWLTSYDKGALRAAVNGAETAAYNNMYFTADSWNAYQNALADAKEVLGKVETTQAEVDEATKALADAVADLEIAEYVLTVTHNIRENADMNADPAVKTVYYLLEEGTFIVPYDAIKEDTSKINKYDAEATLTIKATAEHTYNYWYIDYTQAEEALKDAQEILDNPDGYSEEFLQKVEDAKTALEAVLDGKNETTAPEEQKTVDDAVDAVTELTGHTCTNGAVVVENNNDPDCENDGSYDNVTYCTVCGKETSRETVVVDALGHTEGEAVTENNVAPDCVNDGSYETVVYCSVCGEELSRVETTVPALGHTGGEVVVENNKAPDCVNKGSYDNVTYCTVCGKETSRTTVEVDALGHTSGEVVVENNKAPDCVNDGSYDNVTYCTVCGEETSRTTVVVDALGHTGGEVVVENEKAASCGADGSYDEVVYCTRCNEELSRNTVIVPATGEHVYATETERVNATCTADGYFVMACGCGATKKTILTALGHTEGEAVTENNVAPDCVNDGSYDTVVYCSVCGEELSRVETTVPALGHTGGEAKIENDVAPDCVNDGSYETVVYCSVCGEELSRVKTTVPALGHTGGEVVVENNKAPDCENDGSYDNVTYCTVCGEETSRTTVEVDALGHTGGEVVVENEKAASCGADGSYDEVVYCTRCNEDLSRNTVTVPATGEHVYATETERVNATCTADGYFVMACGCGATKKTILTALGHTEGEAKIENNVAPDCVNDGSYDTVVYCSVCNEELSRVKTTVPALGHTGGEAVVENNKAPDCVNKGSYDNVTYCTVCGEETSRETVVVPALGHKEEIIPAVEADCENTGLTEGKKCSVCGEILVAQTVVDALGHDMQLTEEKIDPDCDNAGKQAVYTCANGCGKTEGGEVIPATGHTYKATVTAPTCTKEGYTTYTCSCGDSYVGIKVPATGHTWGEWIGSGDCTETVTLTRTCTECDATETKTVTGNSHKVPLDSEGNPLYDNFREEDCESGRYIVYTCDVCGSKVIEIGEPLGHKIETEHLEPTCVKDGYTLERCTVCNYTVKTTHEKLGHTWVSKPDKAPTCDENGYENYVECLTCGDVHYDVIGNTGHVDNNGDGKCDGCERDILSGDCGCFCHSNNWIMKIIYAIIRFIWKIFGIHRTCVCGMAHF